MVTMVFLSWVLGLIIIFIIIFWGFKKHRLLTSETALVIRNSEPVQPALKEEFSCELTPLTLFLEHSHSAPLELPRSYGVDRLVLLVRDPYWLYAYWEITATKMAEFSSTHGATAWESSRPALRVYDVTGVAFNGENANKYVDIGIDEQADNWHINVEETDRSFCVDVGRQLPNGRFITLLRSNVVATPRASISEREDEEWMWIEGIYRSYRYQFGVGSPMIVEEMAQRAGALPLGITSPDQWQKT